MAPPVGIEPTTLPLGGGCSIHWATEAIILFCLACTLLVSRHSFLFFLVQNLCTLSQMKNKSLNKCYCLKNHTKESLEVILLWFFHFYPFLLIGREHWKQQSGKKLQEKKKIKIKFCKILISYRKFKINKYKWVIYFAPHQWWI